MFNQFFTIALFVVLVLLYLSILQHSPSRVLSLARNRCELLSLSHIVVVVRERLTRAHRAGRLLTSLLSL